MSTSLDGWNKACTSITVIAGIVTLFSNLVCLFKYLANKMFWNFYYFHNSEIQHRQEPNFKTDVFKLFRPVSLRAMRLFIYMLNDRKPFTRSIPTSRTFSSAEGSLLESIPSGRTCSPTEGRLLSIPAAHCHGDSVMIPTGRFQPGARRHRSSVV